LYTLIAIPLLVWGFRQKKIVLRNYEEKTNKIKYRRHTLKN